MTGGWRPFKDEEVAWGTPPPARALSPIGVRLAELFEVWLEARRFRRQIGAWLRPHGLSFADWVVLYATEQALRVQRDAVSQQAVAKRARLDEGTVSVRMRRLMEAGFVDIGPDAWGWSCRVLLNTKAKQLLRMVEQQLATASVRER